MRRLLTFAALLFALPAHAEVTFDWVIVGDPGNTPDGNNDGGVSYTYAISKYEVTNTQYAAFVNAVAATDTNGLYNTNMGDPELHTGGYGGITRSGTSGSFSYSAIAGRENMPVNWVSFWDAVRFVNWLHNGQPTGTQDETTTEDGSYYLHPFIISNNSAARAAGASFVIPSDDEWYKAAYYRGGGTMAGYWDYPAGTDTTTACALPVPTANTANCNHAVDDLTPVGATRERRAPRELSTKAEMSRSGPTSDTSFSPWVTTDGLYGVDRSLCP